MKCRVEYNDGRANEDHDSIQAAVTSLLAEYPDGVAVDAGGFERDEANEDAYYDIRSGRAALVWATAEDAGEAGTGDDGSHAVAEILVDDDN